MGDIQDILSPMSPSLTDKERVEIVEEWIAGKARSIPNVVFGVTVQDLSVVLHKEAHDVLVGLKKKHPAWEFRLTDFFETITSIDVTAQLLAKSGRRITLYVNATLFGVDVMQPRNDKHITDMISVLLASASVKMSKLINARKQNKKQVLP